MLDLDHLSRQTMGDRVLEREVFGLFVRQIDVLVGRLRSVRSRRERSEVAHTIVGSARAVGAFEIAEIVSRIEADGEEGDIARLADAVERTSAFIADYLAQ